MTDSEHANRLKIPALPPLILRSMGILIVLLAMAFVVLVAKKHWLEISSFNWNQLNGVLLVGASICYAASLLTTALVWPLIVRGLGTHIPISAGLPLGLATQVAKYVPGSVAHYFARAALAERCSVKYAESGLSTVIEITSAVLAGTLVASITLYSIPARHWPSIPLVYTIGALIVVGAIAALWLAWRQGKSIKLGTWAGAVGLLACSFILAGLSLYLLVASLGAVAPVGAIVGIYALAWIAGFAVPGAPAGIGIREAVLIMFLGTIMGTPSALIAAGLHRLIITIVDGAIGAIGIGLISSALRRASN